MVGILPAVSARALARQLALVCLVSVGFLSQIDAAQAATITSTWNFGSGGGDAVSWSDAGNWTNSDGSVRPPDNTPDTFNATIPSPGATVAVTNSTSIDSLTLAGTLDLRGAFFSLSNSFTNSATVQLTATSAAGGTELRVVNGGLTNEGTIKALFGTGTDHLHFIDASLINHGTITVEAGAQLAISRTRLTPTEEIVANTGAISIGSGASLSFGPLTRFQMNGGTIDNQGSFSNGAPFIPRPLAFDFNAGTITGNPLVVTDLSIASTAGAGAFVIHGPGTLSGDIAANQRVILERVGLPQELITAAAGFTNRGVLQWSPRPDTGSSAQPAALLVPGTLVNEGTLAFKGTTTTSDPHLLDGDLTNNSLIDIETQSDVILVKTGATFVNHGTMKMGASSSFFVNKFGNTGVITNAVDGLIEGTASIGVNGTFLNQGTLSTGPRARGIGFFGDFNQADTGRLQIAIDATSPGLTSRGLLVLGAVGTLGTATLSGDLEISLLDLFVPSPSDVFQVVRANSITGTFDNTPGNVLTFPGGTFDVTYNSNSVVLSNFHSVPEPGTLGLGLCGVAGLLLWRRRGRRF